MTVLSVAVHHRWSVVSVRQSPALLVAPVELVVEAVELLTACTADWHHLHQ